MKHLCWSATLLLSVLASAAYSQERAADSVFIERIECLGNRRTACEYIQRMMHLPLQVAVSDDEIRSAALRLSALPNFESVDIRLNKGSEKGRAILLVEVVEARSIVTELAAGVGYQAYESEYADEQKAGSLAGRISDQNLFGTGKILELGASSDYRRSSIFDSRLLSTSLTYIDPQLFGNERLFGSAAAVYSDTRVTQHVQTFYSGPYNQPLPAPDRDIESGVWSTSFDLSVGIRLWSYSYLFASNRHAHYRFSADPDPGLEMFKYTLEADGDESALVYGWDSEDDVYFPTKGSKLSLAATYLQQKCSGSVQCPSPQSGWSAAYKQTWSVGEHSIWTVNVGGEPSASIDRLRPVEATSAIAPVAEDLQVTYSHAFTMGDNVRRARWYVGVGYGPFAIEDNGRIGGNQQNAALTVGLRFESRTFGIIDLNAKAIDSWSN
jgi:outer membrane protein assembly factor BamA